LAQTLEQAIQEKFNICWKTTTNQNEPLVTRHTAIYSCRKILL